jgi:adenylylsulfate kinase
MIILLFGQPASGKTTLSDAFYDLEWDKSVCSLIRIDGDKWRDITQNKDYSKEGRIRNLKGAFDMALYLEKDGYIPLLSFVTPYQELRKYLNDNAQQFVQVYLEYNDERGRTNYFAKDYEQPEGDFLKLNTSELSIETCLSKIKEYIKTKN